MVAPSAVVVSFTPNLDPCVIVASFPLTVKSFGFESVLESPSVSKASISNFKVLEPTDLIIPKPEVPEIKKFDKLLSAEPRATVPVDPPTPPLIVSTVPSPLVVCLVIPSLVPSFVEKVGATSKRNASIKTCAFFISILFNNLSISSS